MALDKHASYFSKERYNKSTMTLCPVWSKQPSAEGLTSGESAEHTLKDERFKVYI